MNDIDFLGRVIPILRKNVIALGLGIVGLVFLTSGLLSLSSKNKDDIVFESQGDVAGEKSTREIAVDVSGAVIKPGLYRLSDGDRVQDGLAAAGGLSEDADREWVEKNLNLALRLKDSQKIYIPREGEEQVAAQGVTQQGLININTGSSRELEVLPGIGPVTAQRIIEGRPYSTVDELLDKKVVSKAIFEKIKEKVSTY